MQQGPQVIHGALSGAELESIIIARRDQRGKCSINRCCSQGNYILSTRRVNIKICYADALITLHLDTVLCLVDQYIVITHSLAPPLAL